MTCPGPVSYTHLGAPLSNAIERDRARTYFQAYSAACAVYFVEKALAEIRAGRTKTWEPFDVPDEAIGCGFTEAVRGVLSHHMVIKGGKIANYHPYPPTPWNANPRDSFGTPGPDVYKRQVKLGCWGPVVKCNVPKRGWINGVGGCPNVGGICIGCTMPGFPDKFMPFMDAPPGSTVSTAVLSLIHI